MEESLRPLILVDVDGPLNPSQRPGSAWTLHKCASHDGTYNVFLNPDHGARLLELTESTGAELVWATMWDHHANTSIAPLIGLPQLPVIVMNDEYGSGVLGIHPKAPLVARYVKRRPFVWFDDELRRQDRLWLKDHPGVGDFRLIHTGSRHGLKVQHFTQAHDWLATLQAGT